MNFETFLALNQIFTIEEVRKALDLKATTSTLNNLLAYHLKRGHILRIRKGLYYTIPRGSKAETCPVDSYLIAAKMADDAVLAHHTALDYYGKLHSMRNDRLYLTSHKIGKSFTFRNVTYKGVSIPKELATSSDSEFGIQPIDRMGINIRITTLERTFVDVLDRPSLTGEWEEIWRSLESIEYFDLKKILDYTLLLKSATTCARVAFFLESHREALHVSEEFLQLFKPHIPKSPHYFDRKKKGPHQLIARWNLIVPKSLLQRIWEEPNGHF